MNGTLLDKPLSRRRFIGISAVVAGASLIAPAARAGACGTYTWNGVALGAEASLTLQHPDEAQAKAAIADCLAEVARLELIFSLHRTDSALSRLNRDGSLEEAPADLRVLLARSLWLAQHTAGAFDPTVQPLWELFAQHFNRPGATPEGPTQDAIAAARDRVGWQHIDMSGAGIALGKPGMAITLNGIAQGYITDKVGDLLRARGFAHVLVNLGEQLILGPKWDGEAWTAGIANPHEGGPFLLRLPLSQGALATSGGYGCRFDEAGRFTHIFDPRTGQTGATWESMSVVAGSATEADGLSTAFSVMDRAGIRDSLKGDTKAYALAKSSTGQGEWL